MTVGLRKSPWLKEADLVSAFLEWLAKWNAGLGKRDHRSGARIDSTWTVYPESCGWDLLLVRDVDGFQIGVEAKLALNPEVVLQAAPRVGFVYADQESPDVRAVLVPEARAGAGMCAIARRLGLAVITGAMAEGVYDWRIRGYGDPRPVFMPRPPSAEDLRDSHAETDWPECCPEKRHTLPAYVPDVAAGVPAPTQLTAWKIKAIKVAVILELRGHVSPADFRALRIDMSRWSQSGWLRAESRGRWVWDRPPDFKAQHPTNYAQIAADVATWLPAGLSIERDAPADGELLLEGVAA